MVSTYLMNLVNNAVNSADNALVVVNAINAWMVVS